ncbi:MAG TPA: 50S ribosomal protein L30 [Saprospiraceae bacterium]|nr:50S ribosomal protein L30 [Saprospiraceae bacterium]HNT21197.1 50S ribosomal protein L30 [Saprospiraceae bacterium]
MTKIRITQTKSIIEKTDRQKKTIKALGLKGVRHSVEQQLTPQIEGMLSKVAHLVSVDKIS